MAKFLGFLAKTMEVVKPFLKEKAVLLSYGQAMAGIVAEKRGSKEELLQRCKIPLQSPDDFFTFITIEQYGNLLKEAIAYSQDPAVGLHMGKGIQFGHHGTFAFSALSFPNAWDTMHVGLKFSKLVNRVVDFALEADDEFHTVQVETIYFSGKEYQLVIEIVMAMFIELFGFILEGDMSQLEIDVSFGEPEHVEEYQKIFSQKITFEALTNEIRIPKAIAIKPFAMANQETAARFEKECDELIAQFEEKMSIVEEVRKILLLSKRNFPSLDACAEQLNISSRTLRRRLQESDTSFKKIMEQVRLEMAERYLSTTQLSIGQISQMLGYEDQNSFSHAFKQIAGVPPSQYRKENS